MGYTSIELDDAELQELERLAAERGVPVAEILREAVSEMLLRAHRKPRSLGIAASGFSDTAARTGDERAEPRSWR